MDFLLNILLYFILLLGAYLIGSFSSAYWYIKWLYGKDIRTLGSKNAGATNVLRTYGIKLAIPVFVTDAFKAYFATFLALFSNDIQGTPSHTLLIIGLGLAAITGHILPAFSNFKGGKGVACSLGLIFALDPMGALIALGIFILVLLLFRMVSLSSLTAAIGYAIMVTIEYYYDNLLLVIFCWTIPMVLIITHRSNIKRIIAGEEKKIFNYKK
jgi:glycerol-3-phosphate acyltransferase PlsY